MKRIYKYPTGGEVPVEAVFLSTIVEEIHPPLMIFDPMKKRTIGELEEQSRVRLVWHYFLVEVDE